MVHQPLLNSAMTSQSSFINGYAYQQLNSFNIDFERLSGKTVQSNENTERKVTAENAYTSEDELFWRTTLKQPLPVLELPRVSTNLDTYYPEVLVPNDLLSELKSVSRQFGATKTPLMLAAFQVLLHRYTNSEDILTALYVAPPPKTSTSNLIPIRQAISADKSFREFLLEVNDGIEKAKSHQQYPFHLYSEEYPPNCDVTDSPIHQIVMSFYNRYNVNSSLISLTRENNPIELSKFGLNLVVIDQENSMTLRGIYNRSRYEEASIHQLLRNFCTVLEAVTTNIDISISRIPLLSEREKHQILFEWNQTKRQYDLNRTLHSWIERQVQKSPDSVAVTFLNESFTYTELNGRSNQLAHYLLSLKVSPGTMVGVCMERSFEMVIALLGILKSGCAYVPIDPMLPAERVLYILKDARVPVILTQTQYTYLISDISGVTTICLNGDCSELSTLSTLDPPTQGSPESPAYVLYTSGSTGNPKGVINTHRGICNRLLWMQEALSLNDTEAIVQKTPYGFDVSIWEFFWPLMIGASLVIAKPEGHKDPDYLAELIISENITTVHFVPSMLRAFLESGNLKKCQCLKRVVCSGEVLPTDLQTKFFQETKCQLFNLYGPTEAAIDVTWWECQPSSETTVPIGRPIANTQIYLLDQHLQPVPVGMSGEIYIGGVNVAKGYLNKEDLTTEKFIPDPYSIENGKLYRTGDLARFRLDGVIEYVNRLDYQVKIKGYRIELGEIEHILGKHPEVKEAVTTVIKSHSSPQLVAYVVPLNSDTELDKERLRSHLAQYLPSYMVPSSIVTISKMPLNSSGKIDRKQLPIPDESSFERDSQRVSPQNALQQELQAIMSSVLKQKCIGIYDDFFHIGGDSILAINLVSEIKKEFSIDLPLATLLTYSTIASLSEFLKDKKGDRNVTQSNLVPIQTGGTKRPFYCVHPAGGNVLCYVSLSRYLGGDYPFYGIQASGFNEGELPLETVEDMAHAYVKVITTHQPDGPYQVGGWSFGGVVALEVALQLMRQGHEVSLLAILDSYKPIILDQRKVIDDKYLVGVLSRVYGGMLGFDNLVEPQELENLSIEEQLSYIVKKSRQVGVFSGDADSSKDRRIIDVLVGTLRATYSYKLQHYPGKVTVFRATEKHIMAPDPQLVWAELFSILDAKEIEIIKVPGHHYSFVLDPHVEALAQKLQPLLQ
ncbi:hypothetical protein K7432_005144 [Basidiobolus ranarum]|uniref:Carrier domain-containing protein n=1 Tax=Basidiobolus ranarum TaxID=34480 RepID=A0ABR2W4K4_9FUNG